MDVLMKENDENEISSFLDPSLDGSERSRLSFEKSSLFGDFEPNEKDFEEDQADISGMKNLMRSVSEKQTKREHHQTTLDSFFVRSGTNTISLEDAEIRIQTLECENAVLKHEMSEIKSKLDRLESLFFHSPPILMESQSSSDTVSQSLLYDRLSTRMREVEKDMVNMKMTMESVEATQGDHEDRLEWLESHYEDDDSRVGDAESLPDLGF